MANWDRPENVPFPSVWRTFEKSGADGTSRKFWVQDLTPEYEEIFLDNMVKHFLSDEPVCKYAKVSEDPQGVKEFRDIWKQGITRKLALICLTKDENGKTEFVGGNMTCIALKDNKGKIEDRCEVLKKVMSLFIYVLRQRDIFSEFNINKYLTAFGLYVLPKFRGQNISTEILKARRELCLAVGIKVSETIFTSIISQKSAYQAGFKDFTEMDYDELAKINPLWNLPGISSFTKSIKVMYIKFE